MRRKLARRGITVVQYVLLAALICLAVVIGVTNLGSRANTKLNQTATDFGNPKSLTTRFGS
jgi:Flp pilus assembly pilin Flp